MRKLGSIQQKILMTLLGGVALGFSSSPSRYFKTLRQLKNEWRKINQQNFNRSVRSLSKDKLVEEKMLPDGSFKLVLTKNGKKRAGMLKILGSSINFKKPKEWDGKWRIVLFDIPEKDRIFRDILREHLYTLNFHKLQHSVFVSPYSFEKSILELVALYSAEPYVRVITALSIDNEANLKKHFPNFS
jgi:phenylacetic acid degradation operon negative regulatory protein